MRPLRALAAGEGGGPIDLTVAPCSAEGFLDPADLVAAVRPETVMITLNHASNVCGSLLPVPQAGEVARQPGCLPLVDVAQTASAYRTDMEAGGMDLLAFTGHLALCGPMGTGGLVIGERVGLEPLIPLKRGGTGSRSER